ncbi:MAG: hypothetical protein UV61_C0004G0052 [Candidatus Gottesmanbacteria bacterium GW2011_GWB1_43_11]|uniref:Glycosyltransferase RgtA/B/C/D-like domain-containing protein n=1 Tax=Candidatus Gottesmanbacteria bacterium GW2011_GWB1_43_11 TaxID=1618446 RepID=A0A0G1EVT2_9BACT|nr:MAG: hypothetical protein UV04_C0007G0053 [Candidatus Gottesmanbacteria bacterium GW2011_GWA2_42_16]KKS55635.1 MAG: hypothetical protein UV17_C0009G0016 [Candidatus Gottesmanbacteria bacterium GW2011_GWA1_42_26]KKS82228.1 MAG: hypothetical protein UV55_C0004G0044 [Candidatus Gottesmanbacteria bacterium GW2011_GWC1_43_10]KKS87126.1 MAG: hypothetical protein UV61_C0004G0052 [Candidatus Gottesmanbacteria bacterium GW2011_GWB1_43_11]OGG07614.1 MAG: hypothetical protein A2699_02170 [Candidatus Go
MQIFKKVNRKVFLLILLFFLGLALRLYQLDEGLVFQYDQARDAYRATAIVKDQDLRLLGPESDLPGVNHGVGYYYLLALPYTISSNPAVAAAFLAGLNALGVFLVFFVSRRILGKVRPAVIASLIFSVSLEVVQYSRWLSNPPLALFSTLLVFWGAWEWIKGRETGFFWLMAGIAASLHFQFFLVYLFLLPPIVYFIYRPKISTPQFIKSLSAVFIIDLPFIISELKFNFQMLRALGKFFISQSAGYTPVTEFILRYLDRWGSVAFRTLFPLSPTIAMLLLVVCLMIVFRSRRPNQQQLFPKFLSLWLLSNLPLFVFSPGVLGTEYTFISITIAIILLLAYALDRLWETQRVPWLAPLLLMLVLLVNVRANLLQVSSGTDIYAAQNRMNWGDEKRVLDYTYSEAKGEPFSICTVTNPLFVNTTWAYMYETYGQNRYGYLPFWSGSDQKNYLGKLPPDINKVPLRFLIFEPASGIPSHAQEVFTELEDYISTKIDEREFGQFKVEKRRLLTNDEMIKQHASYTEAYNQKHENPGFLLYRCYK